MTEPRLQPVPQWTGERNQPPTPPVPAAPPQGGGGDATRSTGSTRATSKQRPSLSLPTDRMKFEKQVEALRSFAQLSGRNKVPVSSEDLGQMLGLAANTAGLCSSFFRDNGWLVRTGRGTHAASDALLEWNRHLSVAPDDEVGAFPYLADAAKLGWCWETIGPLLQPSGTRLPILLLALSKVAEAYDHKAQLLSVLDWLEWLRMIRREGDLFFSLVVDSPVGVKPGIVEAVDDHLDCAAEATDMAVEEFATATTKPSVPAKAMPVSGPVTVDEDIAALISFNLSVRITADDAARLSPEQITSLLEVVDKLRG